MQSLGATDFQTKQTLSDNTHHHVSILQYGDAEWCTGPITSF